MKKSLLMLVAVTALGLAGCGETPTTATQAPTQGPTPVEVPTEAGKCTFYFTMTDASIALTDYTSVYLTGGFVGWKTGYDALELQKMGDTKIYYVQVANEAFDVTQNQGLEFQLVLGYNRSAKMPDASSGLQWVDGRKSDECAAPGGLSNLSFTYTAGDLKVDLGSHTFSNALPKPADPLKNYKFAVTFAEAVPEWGNVYIFGSFNGWKTPDGNKEDGDAENLAICQAALMTLDEARTKATIVLPELIAGDYVCKILVEYKADVEATGKVAWKNIDETPDNYAFTVTQADGDGYELVIIEDAHFSLPDPTAVQEVVIAAVNVGGALTAEKVYVCGNFTSWSHAEMTKIDDDTFEWAGEVVKGEIQFGIMSNTDWSDKVTFGDPNLSANVADDPIRVTVSLDFSKLGVEAQVLAPEAVVVNPLVK